MKMLIDDKLCCGCGACKSICPQNAIEMIENEEGFLYPEINNEKCVNCGLCKKSCPVLHELPDSKKQVFAIKHKSDEVRMNSASGGAFTLISDEVLKNNGVIYGAAFDSNWVVRHSRAVDKKQRDAMRGSKYVQSESCAVFQKVKEDLETGAQVLFTGTPCQVAGLNCFLAKNYDNLLTVDIICHGVMSPKIFGEYIGYISKKYPDIEKFTFRDKKIAWRGCHVSVETKNGKISETPSENVIKQIYFGHFATRHSCHNCHFTNVNRVSDITIGDFWGIEKSNPSFEDRLGVSLVILNSEKGSKMWESCKENCDYIEETIEDCKQPQLYQSSVPNKSREEFWDEYRKHGFKRIAKTYGGAGTLTQVKKKMKRIIKKCLKPFRA